MWRIKDPYTLLVALLICTATLENSIEVPQQIIYLPYDPAIPLLDIYPTDLKTHTPKDICTLMFIAALFMVASTWKQSMCSKIDDWLKKP